MFAHAFFGKCDLLKLSKKWLGYLTAYNRRLERGASIQVPEAKDFNQLVDDVHDYTKAVQADKSLLATSMYDSMLNKAKNNAATEGYLKKHAAKITADIEGGIDEALNLSFFSTIDNYVSWLKILITAPDGDVKYQDIMDQIV